MMMYTLVSRSPVWEARARALCQACSALAKFAGEDPVVQALLALATGAANGLAETNDLFSGGSVALVPGVDAFRMDYGDHLTMFLLVSLLAGRDAVLARTAEVIQLNLKQAEPGLRLTDLCTTLRCEAEFRTGLLFFRPRGSRDAVIRRRLVLAY
jgi:hypothetical protein